MRIACLMPTFNRVSESPHLLAEAVGSFLEQDHADKVLLIGNDTPGQELECDYAGVHVINWPERFPTLGAKIAAMIESVSADAYCRWDDDDYSLPWRLSMSADRMGSYIEWRPSNYWWYRAGRPDEVWEVERAGNTHCMAIWRPEVLEKIDGYPDTSGDEDQQFNHRLARRQISPLAGYGNLPHDDIFYCYRWGVSPRHLSGRGGKREELDDQYQRIGERKIVEGRHVIEPVVWRIPSTRVGLTERPD